MKKREILPKTCLLCDGEFIPQSERNYYCSALCYFKDHVYELKGCLIWNGKFDEKGYGVFYSPELKNATKAHRFAYTSHKGEIPKGVIVQHSCGNRECVKPEHLVLSTRGKNLETYHDKLKVEDELFHKRWDWLEKNRSA